MREEQPGWHLRRGPYDQPGRIPKPLIGLAIIDLAVRCRNIWERCSLLSEVGKFQKGGKCQSCSDYVKELSRDRDKLDSEH